MGQQQQQEQSGLEQQSCLTFLVLVLAASVVFFLQLLQAWLLASRSTPAAAPPVGASNASMDCLARAHVVQQTFDTCQDALGVLKAGTVGDEAVQVTLMKIVSTLARDFPEIANVALGQGP